MVRVVELLKFTKKPLILVKNSKINIGGRGRLRACLGKLLSSLNFRHSISITHHSFFHTHLATSLLFSSLNFFTLFMGPTPVSRYSFFFFFPVPNSPKLILKKKKKKKKKEERWSKVAAVGSLCVFNYNIAIELWVMETENNFWELIDGNRVIVCQTNFLLWVPLFLSYEL